jgi:hypothetical protein
MCERHITNGLAGDGSAQNASRAFDFGKLGHG